MVQSLKKAGFQFGEDFVVCVADLGFEPPLRCYNLPISILRHNDFDHLHYNLLSIL